MRTSLPAACIVGAALIVIHAVSASPVAADPDTAREAPPRVVEITATEYEFDAPAEIPAGPVTFRLLSTGEELHHAVLIRLDEDKTVEDLMAGMEAAGPGAPPPPWVTFMGGPNPPVPGGESSVTMTLRPGNYAWICMIPSPDGVPHAAKGMVRPMTVTPSNTRESLSAPDGVIMLSDYEFQITGDLEPGQQTLRVRNIASQWHELIVLRLEPGTTVEDIAHWAATVETDMRPPPGMPMGGVAPLAQGLSNDVTLNLEPGRYGFLCVLPDVQDGELHSEHGMVQIVTVAEG